MSYRARATLDKPSPISVQRKPPSEIRIFKKGKVETTKGTFLFDDKAGASVMKAWKSYGNDLCFDFEHYSVSGDSPGDGIAAGWFKLELRDDGLYAVGIKWTDQAGAQIAKAEWRYFSPTFDFDKKTGRILELVNVALTNIPATKNLPALVAAQKDRIPMTVKTSVKSKSMKPKTKAELAQARLGLKKTKKTVTETEEDVDASAKADDAEADDADLDEVDADDDAEMDDADLDEESDDEESDESDDETDADDDADDDEDADDDDEGADESAKAKKMKKTSRAPSSHDRAVLAAVREITGGKTGSEAIGVLRGLRANSDTVAQLSQQVNALNRKSRRDRVKSMVDSSVKAGKLMPAQRESFTKIGMRDIKELKGILDTMPRRVRMDGDEIREGTAGATEMTEREREIVIRAGSLDLYTEAKKVGKLISLDRFIADNEN